MSSVSIDPNIYLTPSDKLISFIKSQDLVDPPESIAAASNDGTVKLSVDDVKWLSSRFPDLAPSMLLSCSVHLPSPVFAERDPELEARCKKLRAEQAEREYKMMTGNVRRDGPGKEQESFNKQFKEINSFLILIIQFLVSVACSFMFGFLGPYYLYGKTDLGPRLLFGIICAFIVGCADMYFVIRQMLEEDGISLAKKIE